MAVLLQEIRRTPLLWLLIFVPAMLVTEHRWPHAHTLLFVLSVLAIVPLVMVYVIFALTLYLLPPRAA